MKKKMSCNFQFYDTSNDDVIKWKHFPRYWPFVRGIHRSPVFSLNKGQWRRALMFPFVCSWTYWANNRDAVDLRGHRPLWPYCNATWSSPIRKCMTWNQSDMAESWVKISKQYSVSRRCSRYLLSFTVKYHYKWVQYYMILQRGHKWQS